MESTVIKLLKNRHASRAISSRPIPAEVVDELAEAARLAPSCYNKQPWRYIFMTGDEALVKGRGVLSGPNAAWASRAPLLIAAYARKDDDCVTPDGRAYYQFDLGMSVMNLMLMATERGLTARPMAGFDPAGVTNAFDLGEENEPLVMIAVGYPDENEGHLPRQMQGLGGKPRVRKDLGEIVKRL
jgi:nitroreductase